MIDVQPMLASEMVIQKPKLQQRRTSRVKQSTVGRRLFSTVRSRQDAEPIMLLTVTNSVYGDCPDAVVFRYSHWNQPATYCDENVECEVECEAVDLTTTDLLM